LFIDGHRATTGGAGEDELVDPASGEPVGSVPSGDAGDAERAVASARAAFDAGEWRKRSPRDRATVLARIASLLRERSGELAALESRTTGKPLGQAEGEVNSTAYVFDYYAGWATKLYGDQLPLGDDLLDVTVREPVGVCAGIVPWNFPLSMASWKVAPALACGNAMVLKPSELTPETAIALAEIASEAGVPDGWLNVVTGTGPAVGAPLAASPLVDKVAFTGSTAVGRQLATEAASTLKRVSLELGGKSPGIVLADADIAAAAAGAADAMYYNAGQACDARTRLLVHEDVFDDFVDAFRSEAGAFRVGAPDDPATTMGPLISARQLERVLGYVDVGRSECGAPLFGGERAGERGYFVEPTAFVRVDPSARIAREEIFGPVAAISAFGDGDDLVALANGTEYGLSASIWSGDVGRALRVAREIRAGLVAINGPGFAGPEHPFGGVKNSGYGRELGRAALDLYTETKNLIIGLG
jgi:acyl-CoA reductase-like NAD-dependent aldehyde dehydrogenase